MKRILTILLMTVAFAMNVSVVNAKNSTGQGGTGKEFMMAMMADGDPKSTATINGDSQTWEYGTFQLYSWDSGANITFVLANGNFSYLINGDSEPGNNYKSNSFAGNADKEIIVTVTEMGVINNIYGQYRFVFEKDANQNYVCNYYGEYTGGGGSDDPTPTAPATPTISCSNNTITIEAESGAGIKYIYSTNGNDPSGDFTTTTNNTVTINITSGQIVKVIAFATKNNLESTQATEGPFYYVEPASKPAAPSISINHGFEVNADDGGGYTISNTLTFTESTSGANIYYTTDGTDPKSSGTRQTVSNNNQVVIGLDNNYSNVIKIRAVAELSGTYSDETTMDKAYTPELSTNGTTLSITQNDANTYIFYHGDGETTWTCMKSGRSIDNYANIAPVSVVAATAGKLLSNIAVQNGGGTLPTSEDWDYGSWNTATSGYLQINTGQKLLRYTVSNTRGQNEPTASSGIVINNNTFDFPLSSLSSDGTYYLQILTGDYNSTPIGVYTWQVTKSGSSYTYEYLGKNEETPDAPAAPVISIKSQNADQNYGTYAYFQITDATGGATIEYSVDGGTTWKEYKESFYKYTKDINGNSYTIKARATKNGKTSETTQTFYKTATPTYTINGTTLRIESPSNCNEIVYKLGDGSWTRTSLTNNQATISGLSSSSLLSFRVVQNNSTDLYSDVVTNLAAPTISIDKHAYYGEYGGYVYFDKTSATEGATLSYSYDGGITYYNYPTNQLGFYAYTNIINNTLYIKAKLNGHESISSNTFTKTDDPTVNLSGKTLSIEGDYTGFVYKVGNDSWAGELNQKSANLTNTPTAGTEIKVRAYKTGYLFSNEVTYTVPAAKPTEPTISISHGMEKEYCTPATDDFDGNTINSLNNYITLTAEGTPTIYYTIDGSNPITNPNSSRQTYSNKFVCADINNNYSEVSAITVRAVSYANEQYSDIVSTTFTKATSPTISLSGTTLTINGGVWMAYKPNSTSSWIRRLSNTKEITEYDSSNTVSAIAAIQNQLLSNPAIYPTPEGTDWAYGTWKHYNNNEENLQVLSGSVPDFYYTISGTRYENEPTTSSTHCTSNQATVPLSNLSDGTHYVQILAYNQGPLGVYTWKVTKDGNSYTYEYLGKNETAQTLPAPEFSTNFQGRSGAGEVDPYVFFGISNYDDIIATSGNYIKYSFDGETWKTEIQTKSSAPEIGCILAYADDFERKGDKITIYAKTVNGNNESAVVSKEYTKTDAPTVVHNNGIITITAPQTDWDEIMFSTDGGDNWFIHKSSDGPSFVVYPTTQDAPSYDGESPLYVLARAFKNGGDYIYSDQDCFIGPAPIKQLKYYYSEMENWFEVNSVVGLKIRYTLDGTDPKESETAIEFRMDSVYMDKLLCSSLEVDSKTVKTVATDGYGHFSDVVEKTFTKSDMPIFTDYGASIELKVNDSYETIHNVIYYKQNSGDWDGTTWTPLIYKKDFNTIQAVAVLNNWQKLMSDMLIVEVIDTPPTLTYNQNANQVTITCEEGKTLKYSTNGGTTWQTADGQSKTLAVPQEGLSVQAYCTETKVDYPVANKTTIYTSNVSTGNYTYTNTDPSITVSANWEEDGWEDDGETPLSNIFTITAPGYEGGTIYYTTDGTDPTTSSSVYDPENKPQLVVGDDYALTSSYTIKVLAVADGKENLTFSQTFAKTANTAITIVEGTQGDDFAKVSINNDNGFVWKQIGTPTETHDELWHKNTANPQDNIAYGNELYARTIEDGKLISNLVVRPVNDERFKFGPYLQTVFPSPEGSLVFYDEGDEDEDLWGETGALYQGIAQTGSTFVQIAKAEYSFDDGTTYTTAQVVKPEDGSNIFIIPAEELIGKSSLTVKVLLETGEEVTSTITDEKVTEPVVEVITNGGENHNETGLQVSCPEDANTTECYILLSNDGGETWFIPTNADDDDSPYTLYYDEGDPEDVAGLHRFIPTSVVFGENVETPDWSQVQVRVNEKDEHLLSDPVGVTIGSGWTDWEPYGRGTWTDVLFDNSPTFDVYVRTSTKEGESNKKQIKVVNWAMGYNNPISKKTDKYKGYEDFIFNWNTETKECSISEDDEPKFLGIVDEISKSDTDYKWIIPVGNSSVQQYLSTATGMENGSYSPETDTYTLNFCYRNSTASKGNEETSIGTITSDIGLQLTSATLKMEGMWLGDMTEDESDYSAIQNSYMPANSQYTVGLVKIPDNTEGVYRINLTNADAVKSFFENTSNFVGDTIQRRVIAGEEDPEADDYIKYAAFGEETPSHFKMLDQFNFSATDEGAYYIVVARQVPNGDDTYSYTGAYQYMPVYYSPASNWEEVGNGECTYQNDIIVGKHFDNIEPSTYHVIVEQNTENSGWYRVKNMYLYQSGSEYSFEPTSEYRTYQGEYAGRKNVYFYISTNGTTASLLHPEFYAQPLGVDYGNGEMMLIGLGEGVVETDDDGMHIKFKNDREEDGEDGWDGMIYEWEGYRNDGFEYNEDYYSNWWNTNDDGVADPEDEADYLRFDLFIPTPSKTQPDAPTITYTEGSGKVTISTDEEGTTGNPVYLIYTINGTEPVLGQDYTVENGVPTAISGTNTVVVTGTSTSFYITSKTTVNAKVYCGKYTTPASENEEDEFTIVAPAVQPKVTLINDNFYGSTGDPKNYFRIEFPDGSEYDFNKYFIEYEFTQDGNTLYDANGNSYTGTLNELGDSQIKINEDGTQKETYNATFNPLECYINNGSSSNLANPFNDEHPLIIKMRVISNDTSDPVGGFAYSTPYTQSTAVVPETNYNATDAQMEVTFGAKPSDGYSSTNPLTFYYRYSKKSSNVWSGRIVADEATDFTDKITYTTPSSMPGDVYTVSSQKDHLKVAYEYNITKYAKPDKPGISYDDTTPGTTTVTIHTDEEGTTEHPAYLYYTTDGSEPVINGAGSDNPSVGPGTKMVELNDKSFTLTIDNGGSKTVKAIVYCPNDDKYTTYESDDSIKYCPVWRNWKLYGRGAWEYGSNSIEVYYNAEHTTDIEIATDISDPDHKRIKIDGMIDAIRNSGDYNILDTEEGKYKDFIFEWDTHKDNGRLNDCISNYQYTGLTDNGKYIMVACIYQKYPVGYNLNLDSYTPAFAIASSTSKTEYGFDGNNPGGKTLTLKMDGLWLGDMEEHSQTPETTDDDYAIQYSYMPENSHYKIGLVKIDESNKDLTFEDDEDSDEYGKCYINLKSAKDVEDFFKNSSNFVANAIKTGDAYTTISERHYFDSAKGSDAHPLLEIENNTDAYKMCDQFKITEEGAYYIVAARLVPSYDEDGDSCYVYSGAYRYMPVYYSPSSKWKTLSYDGMRTYRDGIVGPFYQWSLSDMPNYPVWLENLESAPKYSVEVQEKEGTSGLFRVKNMYQSGFLGVDDSEFTSYQGESSYRDGVYFYIDATQKDKDGNTIAELFPSEFYAQPLGVDWGYGETMLASLNGGKYANGQIVFEDYGCIYQSDEIYDMYLNSVYTKTPVPGYIAKVSDLIRNMDTTNEWEDDQFQLQISTPYPLFDDTPYSLKADDEEDETVKDMNDKWPDEYEKNSDDYNEKYGELSIFDSSSLYYNNCYTDGITKGQDHVDVTYERNITNYYGTIMMPFSFKASDLKLESNADNFEDAGFSLYELTAQDENNNTLTFTNINSTDEEDNAVPANHPVVFKYNKADIPTGTNSNNETVPAKIVIDIKDTEVVGEIDPYTTEGVIIKNFDNWKTIGAYTPLGVEISGTKGPVYANGIDWYVTKYGLDKSYAFTGNAINTSTKFVRTKQYRAFFNNESASSSAKSFMVVYDDNPIFTDIDSVVDGRSKRTGSYNVAGQKVNRNYRGIVIENGKKSIRIKR